MSYCCSNLLTIQYVIFKLTPRPLTIYCWLSISKFSKFLTFKLWCILFVRPYPCEAISIISVVLFKTSSADPGEREKAAQLLHLLER